MLPPERLTLSPSLESFVANTASTIRKICAEARRQGIDVVPTKNGRYRFSRPDRDVSGELIFPTMVFVSAAPKEARSIDNTLAELRSHTGFVWQGR